MKTLAADVVAALLGIAWACAHGKHEHADGPGLFGLPPEYGHVLTIATLVASGMSLGIGGALCAEICQACGEVR